MSCTDDAQRRDIRALTTGRSLRAYGAQRLRRTAPSSWDSQ
ncbi:MAG: hypothetical protein AAF919_16615 [Pseudomonadota bacterium]